MFVRCECVSNYVSPNDGLECVCSINAYCYYILTMIWWMYKLMLIPLIDYWKCFVRCECVSNYVSPNNGLECVCSINAYYNYIPMMIWWMYKLMLIPIDYWKCFVRCECVSNYVSPNDGLECLCTISRYHYYSQTITWWMYKLMLIPLIDHWKCLLDVNVYQTT